MFAALDSALPITSSTSDKAPLTMLGSQTHCVDRQASPDSLSYTDSQNCCLLLDAVPRGLSFDIIVPLSHMQLLKLPTGEGILYQDSLSSLRPWFLLSPASTCRSVWESSLCLPVGKCENFLFLVGRQVMVASAKPLPDVGERRATYGHHVYTIFTWRMCIEATLL